MRGAAAFAKAPAPKAPPVKTLIAGCLPRRFVPKTVDVPSAGWQSP